MSYIPLTAERCDDSNNNKYTYAHAQPVDDTVHEVQHRRDTEMADFLIELVCEYSVGTVYGETDDRCEENFTQDIRRYADRYRNDTRYQFVKNQQYLHDLHDSYDCKRQTVIQCNLFFNGMAVFEDLVEFVNGWGVEAVDVEAKQLDCEKVDIEMTKIV